ncbi:polysaccharide export outer membrane protein [Terrimicrobium sacchariphilum]|uniref:Polysaccharide export outer membrane protein n=2 Tax=Terrimicrobium sacchariphilum TaxID=690879 RepID=A0A146GDZ1_TERSA|nr:polysaccharide export outer membrane protein [Terrimicrobium sacchariphilum]
MSLGTTEAPANYVPHKKEEVYRIRIGDVVQVDVFQEPAMTTRQRVQGDGTVAVALLGRVDVVGLTTAGASEKIAALLDAKQIVKPQVNVTVLAYAPQRFTVMGQIKTAGMYVIPPEENISLPEAIAMAGGPTIIGNLKKVFISRKHGNEVTRMRMNALAPSAQFFLIQEGDVIFISETVF